MRKDCQAPPRTTREKSKPGIAAAPYEMIHEPRDKNKHGIAAATLNEAPPSEDLANYVDSACSAHIVGSLDLLNEMSTLNPPRTLRSVGGQLVSLTHRGSHCGNISW